MFMRNDTALRRSDFEEMKLVGELAMLILGLGNDKIGLGVGKKNFCFFKILSLGLCEIDLYHVSSCCEFLI